MAIPCNVVPEKCPECGARDIDVQMIAWISYSDGKSNGFMTDGGLQDIEGAGAYCPSCGHEWMLSAQ